MKKGLLATTALIGAGALAGGAALAAEAPEWKLSGNMNFQFYWVDQDYADTTKVTKLTSVGGSVTKIDQVDQFAVFDQNNPDSQDHDWYFGVDEAELALKVSGAADNGLKYGFKIELNANTTDGSAADEAVISLSGGWGTLQFGDEDGAEDIMNYGGENLMGATGGFDGDQDDYLNRAGALTDDIVTKVGGVFHTLSTDNLGAPSTPGIAGDTSDRTKITYYSPRFSGFQVGASITPVMETIKDGPGGDEGDEFKQDGNFENHYGLGANYDNTFGNLHLQASAVYSAASSNNVGIEDIAAFQVGGIVGWGAFSIAAGYGDNGDSGRDVDNSGLESSFWNVAAKFETGPLAFSAGYFLGTTEIPLVQFDDSEYEHIALTADYKVAPGLVAYAELNIIDDELLGNNANLLSYIQAAEGPDTFLTNSTTSFILGINASF